MSRPVAFTDANVLYAAASRDLPIELAIAKAIALRWTEMVHDEWTAALARNRRDLDPQRIQRTRHLLAQALPDALVTDYEPMIPALELPDADDRHILVCCLRRSAQFVIPGLVPGIHPTPRSGAYGELDPGNKCRDDTVLNVRVTTLAAAVKGGCQLILTCP